MIAGRPDWCLSRQRSWGVPVALFLHRRSGEPHPESLRLLEEVALRVEREGIDAWFELDPAELLGEAAADYEKATDTLDVWFDSGVTHETVLRRREDCNFPADLYLEGSDQHRGWFHSSLLSSVAMNGQAPYRGVLTHGFTVDAAGRKMSKSAGNVVAPQKVIDQLGADILRLWVAATDYRAEMNISDEILKRVADSYRRMRNTTRFLLANLAGFDPTRDAVPASDMLALDRWALARAQALDAEVRGRYQRFEFHALYQRLHHFCAVDMGAFYLDVIKDRQYTTQADSRARRSAQTALFHILEYLSRWLAPILSFTAEEIWLHMPGARRDSVFLETWHETDAVQVGELAGEPDAAQWQRLLEIREDVSRELEKLRAAGTIGAALDAEVQLFADGADGELLAGFGAELHFLFISSQARVWPAAQRPADAVADSSGRVWITVSRLEADKCVRCWHRDPQVGTNEEHPELCARCIVNVTGPGEQRTWL